MATFNMKKNYAVCGVGLGIVAAMENSCEIPARRALFLQNIWRSDPIQVKKEKMMNSSSVKNSSIFDISPARYSPAMTTPASDLLISCHLCKKKLDGKDIYIYRGELGFCSSECRYRKILMEEKKLKKEKHYSSSSSSSSLPGFSNGGQIILSPEILAS